MRNTNRRAGGVGLCKRELEVLIAIAEILDVDVKEIIVSNKDE